MKYIKEILINNFQSHKDTHLHFVNGLNTIIGESDKGKSAVIRAIRWVLLNEPQGNSMVREGTNECTVTIVLNDDTKITRGKKLGGKKTITSKNTYKIEYPNGDISENENFGGDVPPEVLDVCGIKILKIDKDLTEIPNFLFQLEAPFLVSANGAVRSKTIGKLINANLFDSAIRDIKNDITDIGKKVKEKSKDYEILNEKLKEYDNLEEEEKKLKEIENLINKYENTQKNIEKLKEYTSHFIYIKNEKTKLKQVADILFNIEKSEFHLKDLELKFRENKDLNRIKLNIDNIAKNKEIANNLIFKLKNISLIENDFKKLNQTVDTLNKVNTLKTKLNYISNEKKKSDLIINTLKNINTLESTYLKLKENKDIIDNLIKLYKNTKLIEHEKIKLKNSISNLPNFDKLEELYNTYNNLNLKIEKLKEIQKTYADTKERIAKGKTYLNTIDKDLLNCSKAYSIKLKDMGKCPTCFNDIDDKTIQNIIKQSLL